MTNNNEKKIEDLNALVERFDREEELSGWNDFVQTLQVPTELMPALMTGRVELLNILKPRPLSEAECKITWELVAGLVRTNVALKRHAERTAQLVTKWTEQFKGMQSVGSQIQAFANFRSVGETRRQQQEEDTSGCA